MPDPIARIIKKLQAARARVQRLEEELNNEMAIVRRARVRSVHRTQLQIAKAIADVIYREGGGNVAVRSHKDIIKLPIGSVSRCLAALTKSKVLVRTAQGRYSFGEATSCLDQLK